MGNYPSPSPDDGLLTSSYIKNEAWGLSFTFLGFNLLSIIWPHFPPTPPLHSFSSFKLSEIPSSDQSPSGFRSFCSAAVSESLLDPGRSSFKLSTFIPEPRKLAVLPGT